MYDLKKLNLRYYYQIEIYLVLFLTVLIKALEIHK